MKKILTIAGVIILIGLISTAAYMYFFKKNYVYFSDQQGNTQSVKVVLAKSALEREKGLSGTSELGEYDGMLFVFDKDVKTPFWMVDMKIPIDIIFLDKDFKVVYIETNQQPCSDKLTCSLTIPTQQYRYTLEVNEGFVNKHEIRVGEYFVKDLLTFVP